MNVMVSKKMNANPTSIWHVLSDFGNLYLLHPLLKDSYLIGDLNCSGKGAERKCEMMGGHFLNEQVIEWEEGSHYVVEMTGTSLPLTHSKGTFRVIPLSDHRSRVEISIDFQPRKTWMAPVLWLGFRFSAKAMLRGLEHLHQTAAQLFSFS